MKDLYDVNFKDRISSKLFYTCYNCGDDRCVCVNTTLNRCDFFRHSKLKKGDPECELRVEVDEFTHNLLKYVKDLTLKKYIYDLKPSNINNILNPIIIRHSLVPKETIQEYENNVMDDTCITWILDIYNRKNRIFSIDFDVYYYLYFYGKNELPYFNPKKSKVYLDTRYNYFIEVDLRCVTDLGFKVRFIKHTDFFEKYDLIFHTIPERPEWDFMSDIKKLSISYKSTYYARTDRKLLIKNSVSAINYKHNCDKNSHNCIDCALEKLRLKK